MGLRPHRQLPPHTTSTTVDQPFGYTGAYLDTTGLYKMGARSYDHTTNRFTQPDPAEKKPIPTSTPPATPSTGSTPPACTTLSRT